MGRAFLNMVYGFRCSCTSNFRGTRAADAQLLAPALARKAHLQARGQNCDRLMRRFAGRKRLVGKAARGRMRDPWARILRGAKRRTLAQHWRKGTRIGP